MFTAAEGLKADGILSFGLLFVVGEETDSIGAKKAPEISPGPDYIIVGEGETSLAELVDQMEGAEDFAKVPNLLYRSNGARLETFSHRVPTLDELPTPDFEGIALNLYLTPKPVIYLQTSRGCYWNHCTFCNLPFVNPTHRSRREAGARSRRAAGHRTRVRTPAMAVCWATAPSHR